METPVASSFLNDAELAQLDLGSYGSNVKISRYARLYNPSMIHLGSNVRVDDFVLLSAGKEIRLGNHVHVAAFVAVFGSEGLQLADYCGLSSRVTIYTVSDDFSGQSLTGPTVPSELRIGLKRGRVTLEKHVVVGAHSVVMPGVTLREGAAVGALSFVSTDCEPWLLYSGVPARPLKARSRELLRFESQLASRGDQP